MLFATKKARSDRLLWAGQAQYVLPLLEESGGADYVMKKLRNKIRNCYYEDINNRRGGAHSGRLFFPEEVRIYCKKNISVFSGKIFQISADHHRGDCEACEVMRCPKPRYLPCRLGRTGNNMDNVRYLDWVLFDENDHAFPLNP